MSIFVNTNVSAINAQRQLFDSSLSLNQSFERLSSGLRINRAADDSAGLQIATRLTSQIEGLNQAARNANDAISLTQTAEGALAETTSALQRMRQLAVQAQNGINGEADLTSLNEEFVALRTEISRIGENTTFNNINLLDASLDATFLVGSQSGETINITLSTAMTATGLSVNASNILSAGAAGSAMTAIDAALSSVTSARADFGALQNRFQSTIRNLANISENLQSARSRVQDTDFAAETANLTRAQILQQASVSVLAQANQRPQVALALLS